MSSTTNVKIRRVRYTVLWDAKDALPPRWYVVGGIPSNSVHGWFHKKSNAIHAARGLCESFQRSQLVIKGKDGRIQREYTYGADPRKTKG